MATTKKNRSDRAALLGWGEEAKETTSQKSSTANKYDAGTESLVYKANDQQLENIGAKVKAMKEISIQIHSETVESVKALNEMDRGMDTTKGFLLNSMHKLVDLKNVGTTRQMCYLVGAVVGIFLFLYIAGAWMFSSSPTASEDS